MRSLDIWFFLAVLVYMGAIALMWRFWHPPDPLARDGQPPKERQVPDQPFLLDGEQMLMQAPASLYGARDRTQWVGGGGMIAGGGWLGGMRRNRPGYSYEQNGTLWLTDQRLLFLAPGLSLSLPLVTVLQVHDDGHWLTVWTGDEEQARRWRVANATAWRETIVSHITGRSAA